MRTGRPRRFVPGPAERGTYVLLSSVALLFLFWLWRPLGGEVWAVSNPAGRVAVYALYAAGWVTVLASTHLISHFDLFGLRQVYFVWRATPYKDLDFHVRFFYRLVRHPLMLGFLIAFWAAPTMTVGHLLFAAVTTAYIVVAIQLEERDLIDVFGDEYRRYKRRVSMLVPWRKSA